MLFSECLSLGRVLFFWLISLTTSLCVAMPPLPAMESSPAVPELIFESTPVPNLDELPETNLTSLANLKPSMVEHNHPIQVDPHLKLGELVASTLEKLPDMTWVDALEAEAAALRAKGDSWAAGASQAGLRYQEATSGTLHYIDATVQVPLWNSGQRKAEQKVASIAEHSVLAQSDALKLRVAGLVRNAIWAMALASLGYEQTKVEVDTLSKLLVKVGRRVELGDLPRADLLLAQTEVLQKQSLLAQAEAELMHARKRFLSVTQGSKLPGMYQEPLARINAISESHPALSALNSLIERKQAELRAVALMGSGQTQLAIGINSDEGNDPRSNKTQSFNIGVVVPFGGEAHTLNPQLAALNVELNRLHAERQQLLRDLKLAHHEAEHNLEVNQVELGIANELQRVAQEHLRMTELSFSVGEINLIDMLKIESRTQQAVLNAKQRELMLQRDIAFYNQAVGVLP